MIIRRLSIACDDFTKTICDKLKEVVPIIRVGIGITTRLLSRRYINANNKIYKKKSNRLAAFAGAVFLFFFACLAREGLVEHLIDARATIGPGGAEARDALVNTLIAIVHAVVNVLRALNAGFDIALARLSGDRGHRSKDKSKKQQNHSRLHVCSLRGRFLVCVVKY